MIEVQANAGVFSTEDDQGTESVQRQSQAAVSPRKTKVSEKLKSFFGNKPLWKSKKKESQKGKEIEKEQNAPKQSASEGSSSLIEEEKKQM